MSPNFNDLIKYKLNLWGELNECHVGERVGEVVVEEVVKIEEESFAGKSRDKRKVFRHVRRFPEHRTTLKISVSVQFQF